MNTLHTILDSLLFMLGEMSPYILLGFIIAGLLHAFVSPAVFSRHLSGNGWKSVIKSALVGVPLPLCSCGVLPTAISMKRSGASKASTTSFLVSTPQTGVDSIAATWSLLGPAFAVIRPVTAFVTAVGAGLAVGRTEDLSSEEKVSSDCIKISDYEHTENRSVISKIKDSLRYGLIELVDSIGSWLIIGLIIAALINVFVPEDFFVSLSRYPLLAMLAVVVIAIPMYVCATGSIPIALSLMLKGLSPGTALVLLMAGPAANFASFTLISRELGRKSAIIYVSSIIVFSILFGLMIDFLLPKDWFVSKMTAVSHCHESSLGLLEIVSSCILVCLLLRSFFQRFIINKYKIKKMETNQSELSSYKITGMNCTHCQSAVTKALSKVNGVTDVSVNLSTGIAQVMGIHDRNEALDNVKGAGFEIEII